MPGAWEYKEGPDVLVATLHTGLVTMRWALGYRALIVPANASFGANSGRPFDDARNYFAETAIKTKAKWLFFLDSDVCPPADVLTRLLSRGLDIVSGLYYRRVSPVVPAMWKDGGKKITSITKFRPGDMLEVDLVGMGCCLIRTQVFKDMPHPWFLWTVNFEKLFNIEKGCSEDFYFCRRARQAGKKIYVDTSVQCEHIGLGFARMSETDSAFAPEQGG